MFELLLIFITLGSFISLKREDMFERHDMSFFFKINLSVIIKRLCDYGCMFSF